MSPQKLNSDPVTVGELVESFSDRLDLVVLAGRDGLDRHVVSIQLQKPGLVLAGPLHNLHADRLQVLGRSELDFLKENPKKLEKVISLLCSSGVPALFLTRGLQPPTRLVAMASEASIPVICTAHDTAETMEMLHHFLAARLAPMVRVHGTLMDVFGVGILILGESGIGKSECALELVTRGHRLVADDSVSVRLIEEELIGCSPELTRYYLEVRGLGLINTQQMFGITSVRDTKVIEQVVRLVPYDPTCSYDRLGDRGGSWEALDHWVPLTELPVAPGRNVAVLLEISARQRLLSEQGSDAVGEIQAALARRLVPHDTRGGAPEGDGE